MIANRPILLAFAISCSFLTAAPEYRFSLDGEPGDLLVLPVLGDRKGEPVPGDLVFVSQIPLVLREPGHYRFRTAGAEGERVLCKVDDGPEHCVGVRVEATFGRESKLLDALSTMPGEEKKHLMGISLEESPENWKSALSGIDWTRTALQADFDAGILAKDLRLPRTLRYLSLQIENRRAVDLSLLRKLTDLRYLDLDVSGIPLDLAILSGAKKLRNLNLYGRGLENTAALSSLTGMQFLKLRRCEALPDIEFAGKMAGLRVFKIDQTEVRDLTPLNGLRNLRLVSANHSKVGTLPDGATLPALRDCRLLSTPVADNAEALAAFSAAAPNCTLKANWSKTLQAAVSGSSRLRVRSGGTCHRDLESEKTLIDLKDADLIETLIAAIQIDPAQSGGHCMCCGHPCFEFYKGDKLIATIGFHHGRSLRWPDGWPGDAVVLPESADFLCDFLADHGHRGPKEAREQENTRKQDT